MAPGVPSQRGDPADSLLERIAGGDRGALADLHDQLGPRVRHRVHSVTGDLLATELITLGVFATVWNSPNDFAPNGLSCSLLHLAARRAVLWTADAEAALTG